MSSVTLIMGGARSGKSSLAERMAGDNGGGVAFIATAEAHDDEMRHRIAVHQASRPASWRTIEEPLELVGAVQEAARGSRVVVVDCLTLWVSNHLCRLPAPGRPADAGTGAFAGPSSVGDADWPILVERLARHLESQVAALANSARLADLTLLLVSNEVGLGLVPPNALSRAYRDLLGGVNRRMALESDRVLLMVAGIAVDVKRLAREQS